MGKRGRGKEEGLWREREGEEEQVRWRGTSNGGVERGKDVEWSFVRRAEWRRRKGRGKERIGEERGGEEEWGKSTEEERE